ncbi:MAG TPA: DUF423 domain-containing protein [Hyphomicrobiales bacterium]|nr:DUF423 domain-containing protein [Hyphomicrobiales bacterium]
MPARLWIAFAAALGGLAVAAGAIGAHAIPDASALAVPIRIFNTGQLYHALHALALLGVGIVLYQLEGRRNPMASWLLQIAAAAFLIGILCFSGGIYLQFAKGFTSSGGIVPFGGIAFIVGWAAFAAGALSLPYK